MSFHLVRDGVFQESGISELLVAAGTRNLSDNLSDLKAQVAANQQGMFWVREELCIATAGVSMTTMRDQHNIRA
jgi:5-oxoprolinase (ATP-hydrolysing)